MIVKSIVVLFVYFTGLQESKGDLCRSYISLIESDLSK